MAKWLLPVLATITLHPAHFAHRTTLASGRTGPDVWRIWAADGKKIGPELTSASGPPPQVDPYPYCNPGGTHSFNPNGARYSLHADGFTGIVNATTGNGAVPGIPAFRLMILLVDRRATRVTVRMWDGSLLRTRTHLLPGRLHRPVRVAWVVQVITNRAPFFYHFAVRHAVAYDRSGAVVGTLSESRPPRKS